VFDWAGTLVDTAEATYRCYERVFESFGIAFDREALLAAQPDVMVGSLRQAMRTLL
jgi:beta-phosphoglucomutase-like phosphatase (HAD superfamily)